MSFRDSAIWTAVADLPQGQRAAVVLRFAVDLRYGEIGRPSNAPRTRRGGACTTAFATCARRSPGNRRRQ